MEHYYKKGNVILILKNGISVKFEVKWPGVEYSSITDTYTKAFEKFLNYCKKNEEQVKREMYWKRMVKKYDKGDFDTLDLFEDNESDVWSYMYEWSDEQKKLIYVTKKRKYDKETESELSNGETDVTLDKMKTCIALLQSIGECWNIG